MCEIVFQLLVQFYYQLSLILEQKYRDTDKSVTRGNFFITKNDDEKLITIMPSTGEDTFLAAKS